MPSLYRQYRPQTFAEITGQDHVTDTLAAAVTKDRINHAYIFQGPRGTGKTTTARVFAKRLNCKDAKNVEPCDKCASCVAIQKQQSLDIIEIDAASNRGIDDIRALRENVALSPSMGKYKVYIIDEVHMLTNEAFAALLKTLEEPVRHAIFILATTELHKIPPTILSRCQVFRFQRATEEKMRTRLEYLLKEEKREAEEDVMAFIIQRSDGCYRDAESLLGQLLTMQEGKLELKSLTELLGLPDPDMVNKFIEALVLSQSNEAVAIVDQAYKDGLDPEQLIQEAVRVARDGAVKAIKQDTDTPAFTKHPQALNRLPNIIRALLQAVQDIAYVPQPLIALHLAILTACPAAINNHTAQVQAVPTPAPSARPAPAPQPKPLAPAMTIRQAPKAQPISEPETKPLQTKPAEEPKADAIVSLEAITKTWNDVIQAVRDTHPVSSTFLRATEPIEVSGSKVTLRVQFPLHKNFFEKPENKTVVENALKKIHGTDLTIHCALEQNGKPLTEQRQEREQKEQELFQNVQDVFGIKAK